MVMVQSSIIILRHLTIFVFLVCQRQLGLCLSSLQPMRRRYRQEKQGLTPTGSKALTPEQQEIQQLKKRIKQLELEKDILKQASVLLGAGNLKKC